VPRTAPLPLSFAQQRLWFLDQLEPNSSSYNVPYVVRMRGHLQMEVLERSLNEIVQRHETLRTAFRMVNSEPVQLITPELRLPLPVVDLTDLPESARANEARRLTAEEIDRPFDLAVAPLMRATLLRLAEDDHVLVLNTHHIISDRWSLGVLSQELTALYEAFAADRPSRLPELPIQYADYALWQRDFLAGETLDKQLAYWKKHLAGAPASVDLPTDRPRPPMQSYRGAQRSIHLAKDLLDRLRELGRSHGATLFMTLLAAFDVLLSRYSGQQDVVIGTPIAGRNRAEVEKLIGFFVNTLVMRADLSDDPSFGELLDRVRETAMGAYAHQDLPFEKLVEELRPDRDLSRNPLFQVMLILQNLPTGSQKLGDIDVTPFGAGLPSAKFDITLVASELTDGLRVSIVYSTDLFDAATIERMLRHYLRLLEAGLADPESPISRLHLQDDVEHHKILVEFNQTAADFPQDTRLHDFVAHQAMATPDATAVTCGKEAISYRDLNTRANQLANYLVQRGAGPEVLIGVHSERSVAMLVAILGVLKSGSAYVPLDPMYPRERINHILEDSRAPLVLTQESIAGDLPGFGGQCILLDRDWPQISQESAAEPLTSVSPSNLAYVLFTSGSTGRPKGVAIEHHSAATFVYWAQKAFSPEQLAGVLLSTSICFDLSIFEMFVPLSVGGKVIIADNALFLPSLPAKDEVTLINTVPSAMAELLRMNGVPKSVNTVNLAGEALPETLVEQIYANTKASQVYNLYGPTEDTTYSTYTLVPSGARVTIGRPIANSQAYILDAERKPVPIGVPGELYLAGAGLARGYYGRPDLTSERFVASPFAADPTARMYRTGDLARFLPDGNIDYLGRIDSQVKLRGFRIELGEIETVLLEHHDVEQVVVVVREDRPGDKRLVAYVVLKVGRDIDIAGIQAYLERSVPGYMVPSAFVKLSALPMTDNGKVSRRSLPLPDWSRDELRNRKTPADQLELMLVKVWERVLGVSGIGVDDNFFDLGGHSLLAVRLLSEVEKVVGRKVPLASLFRGATVASQSKLLREGTEADPEPLVMEYQPGQPGTSPFFAIAAPGVRSLGYALLARNLGETQPSYKLQASGPRVEGRPLNWSELCGLAQQYIAGMRAVQPEGPYYIVAMCGGCQIAEQMILQLESQGQKVALFAVFDTWVLEHAHRRWGWRLLGVQERLRWLSRASLSEQFEWAQRALTRRVQVWIGKRRASQPWAEAYWPQDFKPPRFLAPVILFKRPKQPYYYVDDPLMGWGARSEGGVRTYEINGSHHEVLREPHVQRISRVLIDFLSTCERREVPLESIASHLHGAPTT
jgi:amino acid adenylation domain-containing protein